MLPKYEQLPCKGFVNIAHQRQGKGLAAFLEQRDCKWMEDKEQVLSSFEKQMFILQVYGIPESILRF